MLRPLLQSFGPALSALGRMFIRALVWAFCLFLITEPFGRIVDPSLAGKMWFALYMSLGIVFFLSVKFRDSQGPLGRLSKLNLLKFNSPAHFSTFWILLAVVSMTFRVPMIALINNSVEPLIFFWRNLF